MCSDIRAREIVDGCLTCSKCNKTKTVEEFTRQSDTVRGYRSICKECQSEYRKENKDHIREYSREYYKENRDQIREHYKANIDQIREYSREYRNKRRKTDSNYAVTCRIRIRLAQAFKAYSETGKMYTSRKYGVDYAAIMNHLGPCPGDRKDYHIDHIRPLCSFDFNDPEQIKLAFAPENHRWLRKEENLAKVSRDKKNSIRRKKQTATIWR